MGTAEWRIYLADPSDPGLAVDGDEAPAEGMTMRGESVVLINRAVPAKRRAEVLLHELIHGAAFLSSIRSTQRWTEAREEAIVSALAPMLAHALVGARLWRGKRVPR